ncbi:MAG: protein tyrosine phosphatase [Deltaproteobacteria bacterium]|nr:protein tyrosine phosphatase [Deltaproteobacteria bacterium]
MPVNGPGQAREPGRAPYVDLHCHLLPGIDDGVSTLEEGVELARGLGRLGFGTVVATPHVRSGYWENTVESIGPALAALRGALDGDDPEILFAAENFLDDRVWDLFKQGGLIGYGEGRAALVEFPPQAIPIGARDRFFEMRIKGCRPVLAHPERYAEAWKGSEKIEPLADGGAIFLVDLPSLAGKFGRSPRRTAERLLDEGLARALCSDAHRPSDLRHVEDGMERARRLVGDEGLVELLASNPREVLAGRFEHV